MEIAIYDINIGHQSTINKFPFFMNNFADITIDTGRRVHFSHVNRSKSVGRNQAAGEDATKTTTTYLLGSLQSLGHVVPVHDLPNVLDVIRTNILVLKHIVKIIVSINNQSKRAASQRLTSK